MFKTIKNPQKIHTAYVFLKSQEKNLRTKQSWGFYQMFVISKKKTIS